MGNQHRLPFLCINNQYKEFEKGPFKHRCSNAIDLLEISNGENLLINSSLGFTYDMAPYFWVHIN